MEGIEEAISSFISEEFLYSERDVGVEEDLFEEGVIDSFGFIRLLNFIDEKFGVSVDMKDIEMEKFNTVRKAADFVRQEAQ